MTTVNDLRSTPVVTALVDAGLVPPARREEAVTVVERVLAGQVTGPAPIRRRFAELSGYVGGALVVSAAAILLSSQWEDLGRGGQVAVLLAIAVVLAVAGGAVVVSAGRAAMRSGADAVRRRLSGVLLSGAAAAAGAAVGVQLSDVHDDSVPALAGFATLALLALVGYVVAPTVVGQVAVAVGVSTALPLLVDVLGASSALATGICLLALGIVWIAAAEASLWHEVATARVLGAGAAVLGAQLPVFDGDDRAWLGYLLLTLVAAAAFGAYVLRPSWPFLAAGVAAVTLVVPEALLDWTDNALGPAGVLLAAGSTLIVASLLGLRLRHEVAEA